MKAIFIDRDGTINSEPVDEIVDIKYNPIIFEKVLEGLQLLSTLDYKVFFVTNQIGIARKRLSTDQFQEINQKIINQISPSGVQISKTYICPHEPADMCGCRMPKRGLADQVLVDFPDINFEESWIIGDRLSDVGFARSIGSHVILVDPSGTYTPETAEYVVKDLLEAAQIIQSAY